MNYKILAINPGSTSTKVAVFQGENPIFSKNITHEAEDLNKFNEIQDQLEYRKDMILDELKANNVKLDEIDAFVGRGGGTTSVIGGVYSINEKLIEDVSSGKYVKHPATLGSQIADGFAKTYNKPSFVVNPPDCDEFQDLARVTGLKGFYRESKIHALNQKEIGIRYGAKISKQYEELNLIICHIGGGVSVTAHREGKMIDSNDIAQGDGPMAPTRCGQLPVKDVVKACFSGKYTERQLLDLITKDGGFVNHLGTSDAREVGKRIENGDTYAKLIYDGMIYQIGKTVGAMASVLHGKVDAVILTGGISYDKYVVETLTEMISYVGHIEVMPGEFEMEALVAGTIRALNGEEEIKEYSGVPVWNGFKL